MARASRRKSVLLVLFAGLYADPVHAEAPSTRFDVPCRSAAELQQDIAQIAGKPFAELTSGWSRIEVSVTRDEERRFVLRVLMVGPDGTPSEREVDASSCEEAAQAASVVLATSLEAAAEPQPSKPEPEPPPERPAPVDSAPPLAPPRTLSGPSLPASAPIEPGPPLELAAGARFGLDLGTLPEPWAVADLSFALRGGRLGVRVTIGGTNPVSLELTPSGGGAEVSLLKGAATLCYGWFEGRPSLWSCGGLEAGRLRAEGFRVDDQRVESGFWSAGVLDSTLAWPLGSGAAVTLGVELALALRRFDVVVESGGGYRTARSSLRPLLGVEVHW